MKENIKKNVGIIIVCLSSLLMTVFCVLISNYSDVPIKINSIEDFVNIEKTGMDKHYIITGYLTFENWIPLGDDEHPFTGVLEAKNPISIKSFNEMTTKKVGIFSVNKGIILGIKVYNPNLNQNFKHTDVFGFFAGINYGKITSCNVYMGSTNVTFESSKVASFGAFCGINYGDIRKCTSTNNAIVKCDNELNYGSLCGKSLSGIIELNSSLHPSSIYSTSVNGGGLCGYANDTIFKNNYSSGSVNIYSKGKTSLGGFVGVLGPTKSSFYNSYASSPMIIDSILNPLRIGCVGEDLGGESIIVNCVSNLSTRFGSSNFCSGPFFACDNNRVENSYYLNLIESDERYLQGVFASFCDLTLSKLKWDSAIWKVSCYGIECIINYER